MRSLHCLAGLLLLPAAALASERPILSWGKPGVTLESYRADAVACGREGYYLDVSNTEAAKVFQQASAQLENNEANLRVAGDLDRTIQIAGDSSRIVERTRPAERMREVRTLLQDTVSNCLRARGYTQFQLTAAQQRHLRGLKQGSPERHAYLHGLASDPAVLAAQKL
ncbi:hypothetical protein [Sphingomonas azotifigens]|uniref:hypothetical protein n=1 Tax=Sphingomonas azotifigens TaxID=330920 RepID=UPI0009FD0113|nr:hypothetical protein [Sphingomonas azotifigens]